IVHESEDKLSNISNLVKFYNSLIQIYFPNLIELTNIEPLRLGISVSHVKYPFHEHWRMLSNIRRGITIYIHRKGYAEASLKELRETLNFLESYNIKRRLLHRIIEISNYSKILAEVELKDNLPVRRRFVNIRLLRMLLELGR
ncbi:MAG: hypothetical protein DRP08_03840, partial [Candidatus Aenigmatarchaeota archaeon]